MSGVEDFFSGKKARKRSTKVSMFKQEYVLAYSQNTCNHVIPRIHVITLFPEYM